MPTAGGRAGGGTAGDASGPGGGRPSVPPGPGRRAVLWRCGEVRGDGSLSAEEWGESHGWTADGSRSSHGHGRGRCQPGLEGLE